MRFASVLDSIGHTPLVELARFSPKPGIRIFAFPSHTIGFQSVLVETAEGPILVAGDILPYFDNWTGRWGYKHIPSGIMEAGLHEYYACFERIEELHPVVVLPGVDPKVAEREVYG